MQLDVEDPTYLPPLLYLRHNTGVVHSAGKHLSELPIDPRLGKMLLMGATFQCLGPILTIAAGLSHKDPFSIPGTHKWAALEAKLALAGNTESDHVALVRAFEGWTRARGKGLELDFCKEYFLSNATMNQVSGKAFPSIAITEGEQLLLSNATRGETHFLRLW